MAGTNFDARRVLQATVDALATMDSAALESLRTEVEMVAAAGVHWDPTDAAEALRMKEVLGELLRSTERSLRILRGIHEGHVRRIEEEAWAR